jgi:hypothetical protein
MFSLLVGLGVLLLAVFVSAMLDPRPSRSGNPNDSRHLLGLGQVLLRRGKQNMVPEHLGGRRQDRGQKSPMPAGPKPPTFPLGAPALWSQCQALGHFCKRPFTNVLLICKTRTLATHADKLPQAAPAKPCAGLDRGRGHRSAARRTARGRLRHASRCPARSDVTCNKGLMRLARSAKALCQQAVLPYCQHWCLAGNAANWQ